MDFSVCRSRVLGVAMACATSVVACGGSTESGNTADVSIGGVDAGFSPFIAVVHLRGTKLAGIVDLQYTVEPKQSSLSRPVHVHYTSTALQKRGYLAPASDGIDLPVIGLYAGSTNFVDLTLTFADGSSEMLQAAVPSRAYSDPNGVYDHLSVIQSRTSASSLGFDFFFMKSTSGVPVVVDTDGEVRWIGKDGVANGGAMAFRDGGFVIADSTDAHVVREELDGTVIAASTNSNEISNFSHNLDPGKSGLLAEVDTQIGGVSNLDSTVAEIEVSGALLQQWDLAVIISTTMAAAGDDASAFVRPGVDWFHANAATYDPRDDTLIVSSRENFLMTMKYSTGEILWILGDPTKYWATFASLRAKALTLAPGGLYPIGQHATSITSDGLLMVFNDGTASVNQPSGAPAGASRTYSAVSAYLIDPINRMATEVWRFENGRTLYSAYCSSAYEGPGKSLLIDYAATANQTTRIVALDANHQVVFDFAYPTLGCNTAWNAQPISFDAVNFE
ncbi:MAG TPA: aryl-sulfate sulfotransferase [Burkholderiaceae bacterium]|nr:aryl-sulfate sulfotransferase [Burkholderiaceae bacterium]